MADLAISTAGLTKEFRSLRAVDGLDLDVPRGIVYGLLGPNGAGKTTTIHLLLGLLEPTSGSSRVFGLDPTRDGDRVRAMCGALLEHHGLYERFNAVRNLEFYGRLNGIPAAELDLRIRDALQPLGLWERRNDAVGKWSKGMKQKLAIARALLHRPPLVFLDEPTAGHDPASAKELRDQLRDVVGTHGTTIFLSTHNLNEAETLCHRVGILQKGRLIAQGAPAELRLRTRAPKLIVTATKVTAKALSGLGALRSVAKVARRDGVLEIELESGAPSAPVIAYLVKSGAAVEEARKESATLEEAYIGLTKGDAA